MRALFSSSSSRCSSLLCFCVFTTTPGCTFSGRCPARRRFPFYLAFHKCCGLGSGNLGSGSPGANVEYPLIISTNHVPPFFFICIYSFIIIIYLMSGRLGRGYGPCTGTTTALSNSKDSFPGIFSSSPITPGWRRLHMLSCCFYWSFDSSFCGVVYDSSNGWYVCSIAIS